MNKIIIFGIVFILLSSLATAAVTPYWVSDPATCPISYTSTYPGFSCTPDRMCGDNGLETGTYCNSNMASLNPPSSNQSVDGTAAINQIAGFGGGFLINCFADPDGTGYQCDNNGNAWCDRNETCFTVNRQTTCIANTWANSACANSCRTGYTYCDGSLADGDGCEVQIDVTSYPSEPNAHYNGSCSPVCNSGYTDCDGDLGTTGTGCEIQVNVESCTTYVGGLTGTCTGCGTTGFDSNANDCLCSVSKEYFETGTDTAYSTTDPLLWGTQQGTGYLMNLSNSTGGSLVIDNDACIKFNDGTTLCSTSGIGGSSNAGGWTNTSTTTSTSLNVSVDTDILFVDTTNNRVGIGTANPNQPLQIAGNINVSGASKLYVPEICLNGDCQTAWPASDGASNAGGWTNTSTTTSTSLNVSVDTNVLFVDTTNNRVGIGNAVPSEALYVTGNINATGDICTTGGFCLSDIASAGSFDNFTFAGDDDGTVISNGGTASVLGGTNGIDTVNTAGSIVLNMDWTEVVDQINGDQLADTITLDAIWNINGNNVNFDTNTLFIDSGSNEVGIGTNNPSKKLEVSDGSKGLTVDPTVASPTINTTGTTNVTITSSGGSVIIQLG